MHDLRRHVHPGPCARPKLAVLEPDDELAFEDEEALGVAGMEVQRRSDAARLRADFDDSDLLDVDEERDAELSSPVIRSPSRGRGLSSTEQTRA